MSKRRHNPFNMFHKSNPFQKYREGIDKASSRMEIDAVCRSFEKCMKLSYEDLQTLKDLARSKRESLHR